MKIITKYQSKQITENDISFIKNLTPSNPNASHRVLSIKLCELWDCHQSNGHLKDMICWNLMLHLRRSVYITLPPVTCRSNNPLAKRQKPTNISIDSTPIIQLPQNDQTHKQNRSLKAVCCYPLIKNFRELLKS